MFSSVRSIGAVIVRRSVSVGGSPTVFTLTLDDLLTRYFESSDQHFKLTVTWNGGGNSFTTDWIEIVTSSSITFASDIKTAIATDPALNPPGTVQYANEAFTEAGDRFDTDLLFAASLGVVTLDFHASSQWMPTETLPETIIQAGTADTVDSAEVVRFEAESEDALEDSNGNTILVAGGEGTAVAGSGWTVTADNGTGGATFTCDTPGPKNTTKAGGAGTVVVQHAGTTAAADGTPSIHEIAPTPTNPTGGTCEVDGVEFDWNEDIEVTGWTRTTGTNFGAGAVRLTKDTNGVVNTAVFGTDGTLLTAPEITHSIT